MLSTFSLFAVPMECVVIPDSPTINTENTTSSQININHDAWARIMNGSDPSNQIVVIPDTPATGMLH